MEIGLRIPLRHTPIGGVTPPEGLLTNLEAFWELEEASGTRFDAHTNGIDLTDNNSVGQQVPGLVGNAASFNFAFARYLRHAHDANIAFGDEAFTVLAWVNLDSLGAVHMVIDYGLSSGQERRHYYSLRIEANDRASFGVSRGGVGEDTRVEATTFGVLSTGIWYLLAGFHDPVADEVGVSVNAGVIDTAVHTFGSLSDPAAALGIGVRGNMNGFYLDGDMDQPAIYREFLDVTKMNAILNSGAGRSYASLT